MIEAREDETAAGVRARRSTPSICAWSKRFCSRLREPLDEKALATSLPEGADLMPILIELQAIYEKRGVNLVCVAEKWQFRTAPDLAFLLRKEQPEQKRLSRAAIETLAIVAYHQPVTRAEIEDIRGVDAVQGHHRRADGSGLGEDPRPQAHAGPPGHLWHDRSLPRPVRARECEPSSGYGRTEGGRLPRRHSALRLRRPQPAATNSPPTKTPTKATTSPPAAPIRTMRGSCSLRNRQTR